MAENSTNVRFSSLLLRTVGAVSPAAAARLGIQLFRLTGPRRHPRFTPAPDAVEHFRAGRHRLASYVWEGGGPTVVLVHGWNGTSGDLSAFIGPLRDTGRRVVAIDLPAHGRSPGRFSDLPGAVDAVEAVLRREPNVEAVIAHSFGVPAAVRAALHRRLRALLERSRLSSVGLTGVAPRLETRGLIIHDRSDREVPF